MSNQDEFKKIYDLAAAKKVNLEDLKKKVEAFPGSIEDVENLIVELGRGQNGVKSGKSGKIMQAVLGVAAVSIVLIVTLFVFKPIPPFGPRPTLTPEISLSTITPTITPTTDFLATQTAQAISSAPTLTPTPLPTSAQVVTDWSGIIPPVPVCIDNKDCSVWQLEAVSNPVLEPNEKPSLSASDVSEVSSTWTMVDPGFHLDGIMAVYLMDYNPYATKPNDVSGTGLLNYLINLNEQKLVDSQIRLTDDPNVTGRNTVWVPLGLYSVKLNQKLLIKANMKANSNYLPIGPMLVVRFPETDQQKLMNLLEMTRRNQIIALLDEDNRFIENDSDKNWNSEPGNGFGGDVIKLDVSHKKLTWILPAELVPGKYEVYVYLPKETDPKTVKCEETEFDQTASGEQQWHKSIEIDVPEDATQKEFKFTCLWNNEASSDPVSLDAIVIVKLP
jgi:hypothetical protein